MKNTNIFSLIIITLLLSEFCVVVKGFANKTHKAISEISVKNAQSQVNEYLKKQLGLNNGLETMLLLDQSVISSSEKIPYAQFESRITPELPSNPCSILNFFKAGANLEDIPNPRARHHFHAPIANLGVMPQNPDSGLDNRTDYPDLAEKINHFTQIFFDGLRFDLTGASAENRALGTEGAEWETEYQNYFAWPDARTYFYRSLIKSYLSERKHYLALTFISLGQTTHLLEDMGVPAHTRNDFVYGHMEKTGIGPLSWGNPFEYWVEKEIKANSNNIPSSWLVDWTPQAKVFDKIYKYFDANEYSGDYLNDGVLPPNSWGLSECTNYQFFSTSTMFDCTGKKYKFSNPAKQHFGTDIIVPIADGNKIYFNGSNYGVTHIARKSYTFFVADEMGIQNEIINTTLTPDDEPVYKDYANITIPRTINYATGLLNYFFRGKLEIEPNCLDCETVTFIIRNISENSDVQQTLKGGTFALFWDDRDGNRTKINDFTITGWTPNSILDYNQQVTGTFNKPDSDEIETYTVVYKGQINENPDEPDDDDDEAIAVATLRMGYPLIAWGDDSDGIVSNIPEGNDFVDVAAGKYHALAIRSNGSLAAWGWNDDGQCDVPQGSDFIAIAAGVRHR